MTEGLLLHQSLLFSATAVALLLLRPMLRRLGGAAALHLSWMALPLVLCSALLPRPAPAALPLNATLRLGDWASVGAAAAPPSAAGWPWLALWATGVLVLGLLLVLRQWQFQRRLRRRLPAGHSPAWVGLWRPRLVLPADFRSRYTPQERRLIRAHERVHARRGDNLWTLLATLLWLLHWFNPLAWWALRRFRADQELAADAAVLSAHPGQTGRYLRALAKAEPGLVAAPAISPFAPHPLIERIHMLKSLPRTVARPWIALISSLALLGSAMALSPAAGPAAAGSAAMPQDKPRLVVQTWYQDRMVDQGFVTSDPSAVRSLRLSGLADKDLLLSLNTQPLAQGGVQVQAQMTMGHSARSMAEGGGLVRRGRPLQLAISDPQDDKRKVVVAIHELVEPSPTPALDPDQGGELELRLRAFIDGRPLGSLTHRGALGQTAALRLGEGALWLEGELGAQARLPDLLDLSLRLRMGEVRTAPRLIVRDGETAVVEFNDPQDLRVVRLEISPRRQR